MKKRILQLFSLTVLLLLSIPLIAQTQPCSDCWIKTELYFGLSKPNGGKVRKCQWKKFIKNEITPEFPDGLTWHKASGQWMDTDTKKTISEPSRIVIILYPSTNTQTSNTSIQKICGNYIKQFEQQSVMRVDRETEVSFYSK